MFETLLLNLKEEMMPLVGQMALVAKVVAALGCLVSIGMITIKAMSDNETINFWAFLRPLSLGFFIIMFQGVVIRGLDGLLQPIARATSALAATMEIDYYEKSDRLEEERARERLPENVVYHLTRDRQDAARSSQDENNQELSTRDYEEIARRDMAADITYKKTWFVSILETLLQMLSYSAKLIINIVGTFFLIMLSVMGPLAFAAACFPVFENSLSSWFSHYVTISLWLPIANIFTAIMSKANSLLCEQQLEAISMTGASNQLLLLAMMVVGIFGYFSVPSVANWIVQAGGSGSYTRNMTRAGGEAGKKTMRSGKSVMREALTKMAGRYGFNFKK